MMHIIVQSMCVPILRSIGTNLTKLENMQNQPEISTTSGSNVIAQIMVFVFSVTVRLILTFDLCYIFDHTHWT